MTDTKLITPQIVMDCEFAGIHRDNETGTLSFSVIFTADELEKALDSGERLVFWGLEQDQSVRISIQRTEQ